MVSTENRSATRDRDRAARTAEEIARTDRGPRPLPDLRPTAVRRAPAVAQLTADNGLAITAVRAPSSPLVQLRLRIPFAATTRAQAAKANLLAETILTGTRRRTRQQIDAELAMVGADLSAQVNPQRLLISGTTLAAGLPVLMDVLADILTSAAYRDDDVLRERDRLLEYLAIAASQPATIARNYVLAQRFGNQPASWELPDTDLVAAATPTSLRRLHRAAVVPAGSSLVLVGDLSPARAAESAAGAWSAWNGPGPARSMTAPDLAAPAPVRLYHRDDSVQALTRLWAPGTLRSDPGYAAAQVANMILGGYFSSRLVENLREDKGFTYHAHSGFEFWPDCAALTIGYDTATDVAAAALVETRYEIGRIATTPPSADEVESARNYASGSLAASLSTQSGYATMLASLAGSGLDGRWLREHQRNLAKVTVNAVAEAAATLFAPATMSGIIVGDAGALAPELTKLSDIAAT